MLNKLLKRKKSQFGTIVRVKVNVKWKLSMRREEEMHQDPILTLVTALKRHMLSISVKNSS